MLFHGTTNTESAIATLREGFKNSARGWGLWRKFVCRAVKKLLFSVCFTMLVTNLLLSTRFVSLKVYNYSSDLRNVRVHYNRADVFTKHVLEQSAQPFEGEHKEDAWGRRYRNAPTNFQMGKGEFVAWVILVVPRHLLVLDTERVRWQKIFFKSRSSKFTIVWLKVRSDSHNCTMRYPQTGG